VSPYLTVPWDSFTVLPTQARLGSSPSYLDSRGRFRVLAPVVGLGVNVYRLVGIKSGRI
jgi:hypothetical protein